MLFQQVIPDISGKLVRFKNIVDCTCKIHGTNLVGSQMERFFSDSDDRNIRDRLWRWSTYLGRNGPIVICHSIFDKPDLLVLTYIGNGIRKRNKKWRGRKGLR